MSERQSETAHAQESFRPSKGKSILQSKSIDFAVDVVSLCDQLGKTPGSFRLIDQILRSGTSVGANIHEAIEAETRPDFIHKLAIAKKECNETLYWLELLQKTNRISDVQFQQYTKAAMELMYMLRSSILTTKRRATVQ